MASKTTTAQDPHYRPDTVDPSEYVWCGLADHAPHKGIDFMAIRHDILARNGIETGSSDQHSPVGVPFHPEGKPNYQCHHCHKRGRGIRYFIFFVHKPTNEVVTFGRDCARRFEMATKEQLDIESYRQRWERSQNSWAARHPDEYAYLRAYNEQHQKGGLFVEFFETLWTKLQQYGSLTDGQVNGLRKWMVNGKPWERVAKPRQVTPEEADRKKAEVTHPEEPATPKQKEYIYKLLGFLQKTVKMPPTRLEASVLINELKAEQDNSPATSQQLSLINALMDTISIPIETRREARRRIDAGLTYVTAYHWIERLNNLSEGSDT